MISSFIYRVAGIYMIEDGKAIVTVSIEGPDLTNLPEGLRHGDLVTFAAIDIDGDIIYTHPQEREYLMDLIK